MEATYNCTGEDVVVKVSTTDPVDPKVNVARYLSQVGTNVFKQQSGKTDNIISHSLMVQY